MTQSSIIYAVTQGRKGTDPDTLSSVAPARRKRRDGADPP